MSVWWCEKCKALSAFNGGICPTCGGQTSFANVNAGAAQPSVSMSMTIGLCKANRHQIFGPSCSFPPECDSCKREADEADAARYRWLRERLEVRNMEAMNGTRRPAIDVRIGRSFVDTPVRPRASKLAQEAEARFGNELDAAIDAAIGGNSL